MGFNSGFKGLIAVLPGEGGSFWRSIGKNWPQHYLIFLLNLVLWEKDIFKVRSSLFWEVTRRWLVVADVSGPRDCPKAWVTTSQRWVTSQKSEDLIYTSTKAWIPRRHIKELDFKFKISGSVWTAEPGRIQSSPTDRPTDRHFSTEPNILLLTSKLQWEMLAQAVTPRELRGSNLAKDLDCSDSSFSCFFSVISGWRLKLGLCYFHFLCSLLFTIMSHSQPYSPNCWMHHPIYKWSQAQRLPLIPSIKSLPHMFALRSTKCQVAISVSVFEEDTLLVSPTTPGWCARSAQ